MIHHVEVQVLVLLLIACFTGMGALRFRLPYTLALVAAGLVLGLLHLPALHGLQLEPELLLLLLLPGLLFEAAFHVDVHAVRRDMTPILLLAVPGVLIAASSTAALLFTGLGLSGLEPSFGWPQAMVFAALISATDPISVLALFKKLGVSKRLYLLVEGESLLNDGVAVVLFTIVTAALGVATGHGEAHALHGVEEIARFALTTFLWMAPGGVLVGVVIGGAASAVTSRVDDHLIETTLTVIVAYGSFLVAETMHTSGVLSTVAAGVVMGSAGARYGMSASTRVAVQDFWEFVAFGCNSVVFLLVGLELEPGGLLRSIPAIGVAFAAVLVGRAIVVYGGFPVARRLSSAIPSAWTHILWWGGLRGALSMVLVISLPLDFPGRELMVTLVFGVVALSLFLQGLTTGPLLDKLGLLTESGGGIDYERVRARSISAHRAREAADRLHERGLLDSASHARLVHWYHVRAQEMEAEAKRISGPDAPAERLLEGFRRLADIERDTLRELEHSGVIAGDVLVELSHEIDRRLDALSAAEHQSGDKLREALIVLEGEAEGDS